MCDAIYTREGRRLGCIDDLIDYGIPLPDGWLERQEQEYGDVGEPITDPRTNELVEVTYRNVCFCCVDVETVIDHANSLGWKIKPQIVDYDLAYDPRFDPPTRTERHTLRPKRR